MAEQLRDFAQFNGHHDLSLALSKVKDLLSDIKQWKPKQQTLISNFFFFLGQIGLKNKTQKINTGRINLTLLFCYSLSMFYFSQTMFIVVVTFNRLSDFLALLCISCTLRH